MFYEMNSFYLPALYTDVVYDTAEDQRTSHKGIMKQEHVYENFPSRESKSRQQLLSKCK